MRFYKVQSNRLKIKELIKSFDLNLEHGEVLIAPRPEPGKSTVYYFALVCVSQGSRNEMDILRIKNKKELLESEFCSEKESIKFCWKVP